MFTTDAIFSQIFSICLVESTDIQPQIKRANYSEKWKGVHSRVLVALAYNPIYSGGRDQEDFGLKLVQANNSRYHILKKYITKKGWWSGSRCRLRVQTPVHTHSHTHTKQRK
jgi:hypothetical protein